MPSLSPLEDARRERDEAQAETRRLRALVGALLVVLVGELVGWGPGDVLVVLGVVP